VIVDENKGEMTKRCEQTKRDAREGSRHEQRMSSFPIGFTHTK